MRQITIIGTGSIGGSFALALKQSGFSGKIVGCDTAPVLALAKEVGAIDEGVLEPQLAIRGSDVVLLATPVGAIIHLIERLAALLPPETLLTDVGSTKSEIIARARASFGDRWPQRFLPGHPMAGKEHGGIEHADPNLFRDAVWIFITENGVSENAQLQRPPASGFVELVKKVGARVITMDAESHDRICGWISHLPQMVATAMAATLSEQFGAAPELHAIGGRALREMTRIASSPFSMWRDVAYTNTKNISDALLALEQRLAHIRENLRQPALKDEFQRANDFRSAQKSARKSPL
jgi:prephenate dehydrogenase